MTTIDRERVARLTGRELGRLNDALRDAFVNRAALRRLLSYELERSLDDYAGDGAGMRDVVQVVLDAARAEGWLDDLVEAALASSRNLVLHEWARPYLLSSPVVEPPGSAAAAPAGRPSIQAQIRELANAFDPTQARQLLEDAGLERGRQPSWQASSAESFWREVHRLFDNGAVVGGWPRVVANALVRLPGNEVLRASAVDTAPSPRPPG